MLLWPTFFIHTEMLPVTRVAGDWEREAVLAPFYSLTSLYKHAKVRHTLPVRVRRILSKYEMKRMALAISVPNLAGIHQPVLKLYQTAIHPALSPLLGQFIWLVRMARNSRGSGFPTCGVTSGRRFGVAMSNQRSFKIGSFRFAAFVPKKIECKRF